MVAPTEQDYLYMRARRQQGSTAAEKEARRKERKAAPKNPMKERSGITFDCHAPPPDELKLRSLLQAEC